MKSNGRPTTPASTRFFSSGWPSKKRRGSRSFSCCARNCGQYAGCTMNFPPGMVSFPEFPPPPCPAARPPPPAPVKAARRRPCHRAANRTTAASSSAPSVAKTKWPPSPAAASRLPYADNPRRYADKRRSTPTNVVTPPANPCVTQTNAGPANGRPTNWSRPRTSTAPSDRHPKLAAPDARAELQGACHWRGAAGCRRRAGRAGHCPPPPARPQQPHHALDEKRLNSGRDFWPQLWKIPPP